MSGKRSILGGIALVGAGMAGTLLVTQLHVTVGSSAQAAPAPSLAPATPPPSKQQIADARAFSRLFSQIAEQLKPSTVSIVIEQKASHGMKGMRQMHMGGMEGSPFEQFFGQQMQQPQIDPQDDVARPVGAGSGVVIDARGYILTNAHVAEEADSMKVVFADGSKYKAKLIGADKIADLAVIKIDNVPNLVAAKLGDSDKVMVGEWVIAIGNPLGYDHSVTVGVLSGRGRSLANDGKFEDYLQTDAAINRGNSGGPLVNLDGEVIGINTAIINPGLANTIGFAIPSTIFKTVSEQLIKGGKVHRSWLGIAMKEVTPEMAVALGAGAPERGALVSELVPNSPALKAGVEPGDVITSVDGRAIDTSRDVQRVVLGKSVGSKLAINVWRNGKQLAFATTTTERPDDSVTVNDDGTPDPAKARRGQLGIDIEQITPEIAQQLGLRQASGVIVGGVRPGSAAQRYGVMAGDILLQVDRRPVTTVAEAERSLSAPRHGGHQLLVKRKDGPVFLVIPDAE